MAVAGRVLQVIGLLMTGGAAVAAFWIDVGEGVFIALGFGGFAVFYLGTMMLRRGA